MLAYTYSAGRSGVTLCVLRTLLCERDRSRRECDFDLDREERWSSGRRDMRSLLTARRAVAGACSYDEFLDVNQHTKTTE